MNSKTWLFTALFLLLTLCATQSECQITPPSATYNYTYSLATQFVIIHYPAMIELVQAHYDTNTNASHAPVPINEFFRYGNLSDPYTFPYKGPNRDTLYGILNGDLSYTSLVITTPNSVGQDRYWTIELTDLNTELFDDIPGINVEQPKNKYLLVGTNGAFLPPGQKIKKYDVIHSTTNRVYIVVKVAVKGPSDLEDALAFMQSIKIESTMPDAPVRNITYFSSLSLAEDVYNSLSFYEIICAEVAYNGYPDYQESLWDQFSKIGLKPDFNLNTASLPADTRAALSQALIDAPKIIRSYLFLNPSSLVGENFHSVNRWTYITPVGVYDNEYLARAFIVLQGGLGGTVPEIQFYMGANSDINGTILNGANNYTMSFPYANLPKFNQEGGFWSITAYQNIGGVLTLAPNPYDIYAVGPHQETLYYNYDGSLDIFLGQVRPSGLSNFLYVPPGQFNLIIRIFLPTYDQFTNPSNIPGIFKIIV